ncbi:MAG: bifunctional 4-hydroxy-2-oxoglutarate aldolase/2-dehydro-3-deoxy-phosphogluconate aldolase [Bacteroidota bacterium]|nr:bifunctional 4-hydroxy-2-oxoglutarate aldolase/2-dehydro-3-deoxy-phosphogluconate aldolase [Bacteroidota bacterium]
MALSKQEVAQRIAESGMVPVFYNDDLEVCKSVLGAHYRAGVRVFEFTNRGANAFQNFVALKKYAENNFRGLVLGIGTVLDAKTSIEYIRAGAEFIVSPVFKQEMANECKKAFKLWIPGCFTPSEIANAMDQGAEIVKLFPANVLEPRFLKGFLAIMPQAKVMPTGGVDPDFESISKWYEAGAITLGMGSKLNKQEHIDSKNYTALEEDVRQCMKIINDCRTQSI